MFCPLTALLALTSLAISSYGLSIRAEAPIVDVGYAKFRGNLTEPFSAAFLGVPYAEPPVGDLRFRAPVPLNTGKFKGSNVIDASSYPDFCVQGSTGAGDAGGAGTEDCLKINIYKPVNATAESKRMALFSPYLFRH